MRKTLTLISVLIFSGKTFSQEAHFARIGVEDGLSQTTVLSIYQDEFDQMWIATRDGINIYDGNKIETLRHLVGDTTGLRGNHIQTVTGDRQGNIYMQCLSGLVKYDLRTQKLTNIGLQGVVTIHYGKSGLWVAQRSSIGRLDTPTGKIEPYLELDDHAQIVTITEFSKGSVYVGTRDELYVADNNRKVSRVLSDVSVCTIFEDNSNNCWVGTLKDGLYRIDREGRIENFRHIPGDPNSLSNNYVRSICQDNFGNFWIGTYEGVNRLDPNQGKFYRYLHSPDNPHGLSHSSVISLYKDHQGSIWIGTYFGGVNIINPQYAVGRYYYANNSPGSLDYPVVSGLTQGTDGKIWVCTEGGGLNLFDPAEGKFTNFRKNPEMPLNLKTVFRDEQRNCLWLGSHLGGFNRFDPETRRTTRIRIGNTPQANDYVRAIVSHKGKLFLGTHNSVVVYEPDSGRAYQLVDTEKYPDLYNRQIWDMMADSKDNLWFSTASAVYKYNLNDSTLVTYTHDPANPNSIGSCYLNTFFETRDHDVLIGSAGSGISIYDPGKDIFRHITTRNSGIIDDYILSINQSPMGYILIATNLGLSRYDKENDSFTNYPNREFFHFASMNERSLHAGNNGEIFISSINGLVVLNERDLNVEPTDFKVNVTRLYANNSLITPLDSTEILSRSMFYTRHIRLKHKYTVFSVEFVVSNYLKAIKPKVEYKLVGFDNNWVQSDRNIITYTNLAPGRYNLIIRATDGMTVDKIREASLMIEILPPFYKTVWALLLYAISSVLIAYFLIRNYTSRIELKSSLAFSENEKHRIEELNQSKLRFFTNISHEFRTPLTLIKTQLEQIIESDNIPHGLYKKILNMLRSSEKMSRLVNELLDFRKQEQDFLTLKVKHTDIVALINEIYMTFREFARSKNIEFRFDAPQDVIRVWLDHTQIEKVFYNLLSNAFKFTPAGNSVTIKVEEVGEDVVVSFIDTGIGVPDEHMENIFDRFFQVDNHSPEITDAGTGIGLALSRVIVKAHQGRIWAEKNAPSGTVIKVSLPLSDHFGEEFKACNDNDDVENILWGTLPDREQTDSSSPDAESSPETDRSILIVDDNEELLSVLSSVFVPLFTVYTATDGLQGYNKTLELQPDIVLADIMMPKISGTEMCRKIKSNILTSHIPVVLLTARVAPEQTIEGLLTGADDYITKPFNVRILLARCNNIINARKALQERYSKGVNVTTSHLTVNPYEQQFIDRAVKIIENNITNQNFDVNEFAERMNLGRTSLFQKIKGVTGQTPNEFIMSIRLKMAIKLLCDDKHLNVNEISSITGFSDPPYFIRCFKKVYGVTPTQYRKKTK